MRGNTVKTQAYRNLTNGKWSLRQRDAQGKFHVVGHCDALQLIDVTTRTSAKQRQWCINKGERNVHAWLEGTLVSCTKFQSFKSRGFDMYMNDNPGNDIHPITYHPGERDDFFYKDTRATFTGSTHATLTAQSQVFVS
jgi:hypothetical protein